MIADWDFLRMCGAIAPGGRIVGRSAVDFGRLVASESLDTNFADGLAACSAGGKLKVEPEAIEYGDS